MPRALNNTYKKVLKKVLKLLLVFSFLVFSFKEDIFNLKTIL